MPGLEIAVAELANEAGIKLALGTKVPLFSGRGHLNEVVQASAPASTIDALAAIHMALGGDAELLATKRAGGAPTPDLIHVPSGMLIEVDEVQHFTTARERSLSLYPAEAKVAFDLDSYRSLVPTWRARGDAAAAHKTSRDRAPHPVAGRRSGPTTTRSETCSHPPSLATPSSGLPCPIGR